MTPLKIVRGLAIAGTLTLVAGSPALAHHGFGLFQMEKLADWSGTLTKFELVNPHSYLYFDTVGADGKPLSMRCEMRAATLIKRSGWKTEEFVPGRHVDIHGHPHRDDPHSCYLESVTIGGKTSIDRNDQFTRAPVDTSKRPLRLASGEPNISGDWAVEQAVLTIPPSGGRGDLVPRSVREAYAAGKITLAEIRARNPAPSKPQYTPAGQAAATAFRMWSPEDNPRLSCKPTSIIFDWTFDWPVNRITQTTVNGEKVIDIDYGLYSNTRRIHLGLDKHPSGLVPSNAGHSIGRWDGDTLVVDTVGFTAGVLVPPTKSSDKLHVVERFTFDPKTFSLKREYTVEDPVYLAAPYTGQDTVLLSDTPFEKQRCSELTYEFTQPGN
ncbi:MAG TPA: DUF6152 family protein [Gammaproteobacteria bacterium]|jgi:hypothetical protein|nr:DUF6152 family protein [Gammaproteobacteria bacterium]